MRKFGMEKRILLNNEQSSSSLFSQPLSYYSSSSIFLLQSPLQSPPPEIMSSSNTCSPTAFYFQKEDSSPFINSSKINNNNNELANNNEGEFSFLESKPSLLDQRLLKGGGKPPKGRRNAAEALYRRKLANEAFLIRTSSGRDLVGTKKSNLISGWNGGNRRKGHLMTDYFAPYVSYSVNRKCRWLRDGVDWLYELSEGFDGQDIRFCLAETNYSLNGNKFAQKFHCFDTENNNLKSKISKSKKGAILADLQKAVDEDDENNENEVPKKQFNFNLIKPNLLKKIFAGKIFTRKDIYKYVNYNSCTKSSSIESNNKLINKKSKRHLNLIESEPEDENEFLAQYRPKREETYSLADFIKNNNNSSLLPINSLNQQNRRKRCCSSSINLNSAFEDSEDGQYTIVPKMECVELPDDLLINNNNKQNNNNNNIIIQQQSNNNNNKLNNQIISSLHQRINKLINSNNNNNYLNIFSISKNYLTTKSFFEWKPQLLGDNLFLIDLSSFLEIKILNNNNNNLLLFVLIINKSNIFINSLIPLDEQKLQNIFLNNQINDNFDEIIKNLLKIVKADFTEWEINQKHFQLSSSFDNLRSIYHSPQLALTSKPLSVLSILEIQKEELKNDESQFVIWNNNDQNNENNINLSEEDDDDFEIINIINELNNNNNNQQLSSTSLFNCFNCHLEENEYFSLAMITSCGHRFCRQCLINNIKQQLINNNNNKLIINCPLCKSQFPLNILIWLFPLQIVNNICLLYYINNNNNIIKLIECFNCKTILKEEEEENKNKLLFNQIICIHCSIYFCKNCGKEPHWPLNCLQYNNWNNKRLAQPTEEENNDIIIQKQITGQFVELSNEARTRRMDKCLAWQLGKHIRRIFSNKDSSIEKRFGILRKTALHILEYSTIWLYFNRQQRPRPVGWSQLKSLFGALRDRIESLDNELLFSGSLTDSKQLILRFGDLEQLNEKCLVKIGNLLK